MLWLEGRTWCSWHTESPAASGRGIKPGLQPHKQFFGLLYYLGPYAAHQLKQVLPIAKSVSCWPCSTLHGRHRCHISIHTTTLALNICWTLEPLFQMDILTCISMLLLLCYQTALHVARCHDLLNSAFDECRQSRWKCFDSHIIYLSAVGNSWADELVFCVYVQFLVSKLHRPQHYLCKCCPWE